MKMFSSYPLNTFTEHAQNSTDIKKTAEKVERYSSKTTVNDLLNDKLDRERRRNTEIKLMMEI